MSISKSYKRTGYVKNLPTGKVETLVEGERKAVLKMIEEIDEKLKGFWAKKREEIKSGKAHYEKFEIKYY